MLYLVTQIVLCLLFTTLVGLTVGWLLRGMGTARQTDQVEAKWRAQLERLQAQRDNVAMPAAPSASDGTDVAQLRQLLVEREQEITALRDATTAQPDAPIVDAQVREQLQASQTRCQQLQVRLADFSTANDQLEKQLEHTVSERQNVVERLRETETAVGRLTQEREHAINTIAGLQKEMRALRGTVARFADTAATATNNQPAPAPDASIVQTAGASTNANAQPAHAFKPAETASDRQQDLPIESLQSEKPSYEPTWRLPHPDGNRDNLQAIYGVGPKLEERLNEMGIFHFRQIEIFEKRDILWVAQHLRSFPGRILRDRWVEQARTLEARRRSGKES